MRMGDPKSEGSLPREVGLIPLVFYGTGTILGAGIFVVIGEVLGVAGGLTPLAYLLAAFVAVTTALSYSEMAARIPTAGGPIDYVEKAFGKRWLGSLTGWALMIANVVSAATITTGFVAYMDSFLDITSWIVTVSFVVVISGVAAVGMKESAWLMTVTTLIGIATLVFVLWALRDGLTASPQMVTDSLTDFEGPLTIGLFGGAFLAIYSFIGFGDMAQTAEEVRDVKTVLPAAMLFSLGIVFVFYITVSMALVGSGGFTELADAEAPLVRAVGREGWPEMPIAISSLSVIANSALTQLLASARLLYDTGRDERGAPRSFGKISAKTQTPVLATIACGAVIMALALFVPLKQLASATSYAILLVFIGVNASLIVAKRRDQPDDVPDIWPIVPVLGVVFCLVALLGQLVMATS